MVTSVIVSSSFCHCVIVSLCYHDNITLTVSNGDGVHSWLSSVLSLWPPGKVSLIVAVVSLCHRVIMSSCYHVIVLSRQRNTHCLDWRWQSLFDQFQRYTYAILVIDDGDKCRCDLILCICPKSGCDVFVWLSNSHFDILH